jgi:hypothetical protein
VTAGAVAPQRGAGFAAEAAQITAERLSGRVQDMAVRTVDLAHVATLWVAAAHVALLDTVVCSAALQAASGCRSVWTALGVVNHPQGVGLDHYRRAMHMPGVPVGTDG